MPHFGHLGQASTIGGLLVAMSIGASRDLLAALGGGGGSARTSRRGLLNETLVPKAIVSEVARRHGLTPQQVFTWRRQACQPLANTESKTPQFVPAIVSRRHHHWCCEDGSASRPARPAEAPQASRLRSMA